MKARLLTRHMSAICALGLMLSPLGLCQSVVSYRTIPQVLTLATQNVLLEVTVSGSPTRVVLEASWQAGLTLDLHDDGTSGDKAAGDGIYSVQFAPAGLLASMRADDVFRVLMGYVNVFQGSTSVARPFTMAEVYTSEIPMAAVTSDSPDMQHTDYVVNILMPSAFPSGNSSTLPDVRPVAQKFYHAFPDDFDVLNIVFAGPSFFQNRFHFAVQSAVQGIGISRFNSSALYGSAGRLLGISEFPLTSYFDGADTGVQHELGHQFIAFLRTPAFLVPAIPHWPYSTMASGVMGFSIGGQGGQGGEFPCLITPEAGGYRLRPRTEAAVFNDLDLYLMGLLPADQVSDQYVFRDQSAVPPCDGRLFTGAMDTMRISDVTEAYGSRLPDTAQSQKTFRLATIILTRDTLLSAEAMAFYTYFAKRMEGQTLVPSHQGLSRGTAKPFAITTRGLGTIVARVDSSQACPLSFPMITKVQSAAGFGGYNFFTSGSYLEITGFNLAGTTREWLTQDFNGSNAPTALDGIAVSVNNKPGFISYISPGQINVQAPDDNATGPVGITLTNCSGTSAPAVLQKSSLAPGMLAPSAFRVDGKQYLVATFGLQYLFVGTPGLLPGAPFQPAKPHDIIWMYGIGFGNVAGATVPGVIASSPGQILAPVTISFGQTPSNVIYKGLYAGYVGLYLFIVEVPEVPDGDFQINITVNGQSIQQEPFFLTVKR